MQRINKTQLLDIQQYSKNRCRNIIEKLTGNDKYFMKGKYKGYLYISKSIGVIIEKDVWINKKELYLLVKVQKNSVNATFHKEPEYIRGIVDSLYDILGYISSDM